MKEDHLKFIPSQYVRDYYKSIGHDFSDMDLATIIYHTVAPQGEMHRALEEMAAQTEDEELKKQIRERLAYDTRCQELFEANDGTFFYQVTAYEEGDPGEEEIIGHFAGAGPALEFGKGRKRPFQIEKYQLADLRTDLIIPQGRFNPRLCPDAQTEELPYDGSSVGWYRCDADGNILRCWSGEIPREEKDRVEDWGERRFEDRFIPFPNPFDLGQLVRMVGDPEQVGVVETSDSDWLDFLARVKERPRAEDFSDASIQVEFLSENGHFGHDHICPLFLEPAELEESDERKPLLEAASRLVAGTGALDEFLWYYRDYGAALEIKKLQRRFVIKEEGDG